jgi:hypothetical protein
VSNRAVLIHPSSSKAFWFSIVRLIAVHTVGFQSSLVISSSEYEDLPVAVCSFTLPRTVVLPHVIVLGAKEFSIFSTGLGRLRLGGGFGGEDSEVVEKGLEKLAAKLEASPELARRKLRAFSGEVERPCPCWLSCSELPRFDRSGGVSPHEYDADAGSLPQTPLEDPTDPYRPDGVWDSFGVETTELMGVLWYILHAAASVGK